LQYIQLEITYGLNQHTSKSGTHKRKLIKHNSTNLTGKSFILALFYRLTLVFYLIMLPHDFAWRQGNLYGYKPSGEVQDVLILISLNDLLYLYPEHSLVRAFTAPDYNQNIRNEILRAA